MKSASALVPDAMKLLKNKTPVIRIDAAWLLGELKASEAVDALMALADIDPGKDRAAYILQRHAVQGSG